MLLSILLVAQSCWKIETADTSRGKDPEPVADNKAIEFSAAAATKGLDPVDNLLVLDEYGFGVFAGYSEPGKTFGSTTIGNNYIHNLKVNRKDETSDEWVPKNPAYWPLTGSLTFFAYASFIDNVEVTEDDPDPSLVMPTADYEGGLLRGRFTPRTDVTRQEDFCLAEPVKDRKYEDGRVPFAFKHSLTRVRFYMRGDGVVNEHYKYRITSIKLKGIVGTNGFTYTEDPDVPCKWDRVSASSPRSAEYTLTGTQLTDQWIKMKDPSETGLEGYEWINSRDDGRLYLLPQDILEGAAIEVVVTIYSPDGDKWVPVSTLPMVEIGLATPDCPKWEPGKTVSYTVTLQIPEIRVAEISALITDWEVSGNVHDPQLID